MYYLTGEKVEIGDNVLIENKKTQGIIHAIIENPKDMQDWGLDEKGVSIESEPFGLVFWTLSDSDPVVFVSRKD